MYESGSFKFRILDATSPWRRAVSDEHDIGGFAWSLYSRREVDEADREWLECCLCCGGEVITDSASSSGDVSSMGGSSSSSSSWACTVVFTCSLISLTDEDLTEGPILYSFNSDRRGRGIEKCFAWDDIVDPQRGFLLNDSITLKIQLELKNHRENPRRSLCSFDVPSYADVLLVVEERKVYASKMLLAMHSPVFAAMFLGNFHEFGKTEIVLPGVVHAEFIDFLKVIYPERKKVTEENVEHLLRLAEKFDCIVVLDKCEKFLLRTSEVCLSKKLLYAERHRLPCLMDKCLSYLSSPSVIRELAEMPDFENYGDTLLRSIIKRVPRH